jgi:hypothetical protein
VDRHAWWVMLLVHSCHKFNFKIIIYCGLVGATYFLYMYVHLYTVDSWSLIDWHYAFSIYIYWSGPTTAVLHGVINDRLYRHTVGRTGIVGHVIGSYMSEIQFHNHYVFTAD